MTDEAENAAKRVRRYYLISQRLALLSMVLALCSMALSLVVLVR